MTLACSVIAKNLSGAFFYAEEWFESTQLHLQSNVCHGYCCKPSQRFFFCARAQGFKLRRSAPSATQHAAQFSRMKRRSPFLILTSSKMAWSKSSLAMKTLLVCLLTWLARSTSWVRWTYFLKSGCWLNIQRFCFFASWGALLQPDRRLLQWSRGRSFTITFFDNKNPSNSNLTVPRYRCNRRKINYADSRQIQRKLSVTPRAHSIASHERERAIVQPRWVSQSNRLLIIDKHAKGGFLKLGFSRNDLRCFSYHFRFYLIAY